ncbi:fluoride efflux transporter CrcB [Erythrobacter sp. SCSIO 43205]|uniref:fluoride efflux transporter CrcB n=1 Tax=Erythrobacter sp. SCSIO 43205 TaxID=2779361 RepID=UPI001CA9D1E5|nr:fluoride efflux transporter CrcB [Erythrobacter sp. SCSIO 43205]UAB79087.1 fluoride efflux transporter CrcB [Erythrobacter sp. SCSIO 43205]
MSSQILTSLMPTLAVALGGAIGAAARYQVGGLASRLAGPHTDFPWGTLSVNIIGSLIMGLLLGWFAKGGTDSENLRLFLVAGLMGGFTTFSAFSAEMVTMLHRGEITSALIYVSVSVIAGMAAFLIGLVGVQAAP